MSSPIELAVDGDLVHAGQYYDPAKAREYYLRTRELKGRARTSGNLKTDSKKDKWAYTKSEITEAKKTEMKEASTDRTEQVKAIRASATQRRQAISEKVSALLKVLTERRKDKAEDITDDRKAEAERIAKRATQKIAALGPAPKGATPEERAKRSEKIAKIRGEASTQREKLSGSVKDERGKLSEKTKADKSGVRDSGKAEREAVSADLKASVATARDNYEKLKEDLKAKYESEYQQEFEAIRDGR